MPSTYTTRIGLEKPGNGEQTNTWGTTANENFDIIDVSINGVKGLTLSGSSSTLTTTDGAISDGHYPMLILSGSLSGTHTITISPDTAQKMYFVYNTTSHSVVFTQGSGGNATVTAGDSGIIYADGGGATAAVVSLSDQLGMSSTDISGGSITGVSISGLSAPLPVADGGTGGSTPSAARTALELGSLATLNSGTGGGDVRTNTQNDARFQAFSTDLTAIAALTSATNKMPYATGAGTWAMADVTTFARSFLNDSDAASVRATIGAQVAGSYVETTGSTLTGGFATTEDNDGTFSSGTYTPALSGGNWKTISNAGAFTLAAPSDSGAYNIVIQMTNASGAGAVTFSGFTAVFGQSLTTTVGHIFRLHICKVSSVITMTIEGMQ